MMATALYGNIIVSLVLKILLAPLHCFSIGVIVCPPRGCDIILDQGDWWRSHAGATLSRCKLNGQTVRCVHPGTAGRVRGAIKSVSPPWPYLNTPASQCWPPGYLNTTFYSGHHWSQPHTTLVTLSHTCNYHTLTLSTVLASAHFKD